MNSRERIAGILRQVTALPTLPAVATQLLKQADERAASLKEISTLVERDPAVATRLLKLVNSPFFGARREVTSVQQALLLVGIANLKSLVLSSSVINMFNHSGKVGSFDRSQFWEHCLGVAMCARQIAAATRAMDADEAFTAGLIHDIGKMIIDQFLHEDFGQIIARADTKKCTLYDAEQHVLSVTHAEIGQYLACYWGLPEVLQIAIGFHHSPEDASQHAEAAAVVCLADEFARAAAIGLGGGADPQPSEAARDLAKISTADSEKLKSDLRETLAKSADSAKMI
jgi:putative nucleotidyltransferase with HDIG domain